VTVIFLILFDSAIFNHWKTMLRGNSASKPCFQGSPALDPLIRWSGHEAFFGNY